MKKLFLLLLVMTASVAVNAQEELDSLLNAGYEITKTYTDEEIETHATMPEFPGGNKALRDFLRDNLKFPSIAAVYGFEGVTHVQFVVEKDGTVDNVVVSKCTADSKVEKFLKKNMTKQQEIKQKVTAAFAKEGARLVKKMPKWKPGNLDGQPVRVNFTLPIKFRLKGIK